MLLACFCRALALDTTVLSASMQHEIMQITRYENATQSALACDRWVLQVADAVKSSIEKEGKYCGCAIICITLLSAGPKPAPNWEVLIGACLGGVVGAGTYYLFQNRESLRCPQSSGGDSEYIQGVATTAKDEREDSEGVEMGAGRNSSEGAPAII